MFKPLLSALLLAVLAAGASAQDAPEAPEASPTEQVLVSGQRPGPSLWKVTKGDHVLWVFGSYSPLPKKMEWRSREVEAILSQTQEVLDGPGVVADVGFFRALTLLPHLIGARKNPDGASLKDVLPPEAYARWLVLKEKYIGKDDGIEDERPIFAAETLYNAALNKAGLESDRDVVKAIDAMIKKNKIKVTDPRIKLQFADPSRLIKSFKKGTLDDVACLTKTMDRLENDIETMRRRANAWAIGDLETIERSGIADRRKACSDAMTSGEFMKGEPDMLTARERANEAWLAAVEKSLAANLSTFSALPFDMILDPKGLLARLEAKGYAVIRPE